MYEEPSNDELDFVVAGLIVGVFLMPGLILYGLYAQSVFATLAFFALAPFWIWVARRPIKWLHDAEMRAGLPIGFYG